MSCANGDEAARAPRAIIDVVLNINEVNAIASSLPLSPSLSLSLSCVTHTHSLSRFATIPPRVQRSKNRFDSRRGISRDIIEREREGVLHGSGGGGIMMTVIWEEKSIDELML